MPVDFIDRTGSQAGTRIDRKHLMAMQGFIPQETFIAADGSITVTNSDGETLTTEFLADGSIRETFKGTLTIVKTTSFGADGTISEVIA